MILDRLFRMIGLLTSLLIVNYTNNMRFETTVYKPENSKELLIKVLRFDTEEYFDYMQVDTDGKSLLYSGRLEPYNIMTNSSVRITFTSDMTTTYEGIELEVYA